MKNEPIKKQSPALAILLTLNVLLLSFILTEYIESNYYIRGYNCEVTHLQGVVDAGKWAQAVGASVIEKNPGDSKAEMVGTVAISLGDAMVQNASMISPGVCAEVELTFVELQWLRIKQYLQQ